MAFPCISTGLFAFPSDLASQLALRAVDEWYTAHPSSDMRVIFALFLPADVAHYTQALKVVFPSITEAPKKIVPRIPPEVIEAIRNADAIMIRAGAGLSADAVHPELNMGLDYTSTSVFAKLYPGLVKHTRLRRLYDTVSSPSTSQSMRELKLFQFGGEFADVRSFFALHE